MLETGFGGFEGFEGEFEAFIWIFGDFLGLVGIEGMGLGGCRVLMVFFSGIMFASIFFMTRVKAA